MTVTAGRDDGGRRLDGRFNAVDLSNDTRDRAVFDDDIGDRAFEQQAGVAGSNVLIQLRLQRGDEAGTAAAGGLGNIAVFRNREVNTVDIQRLVAAVGRLTIAEVQADKGIQPVNCRAGTLR